MKFIHFTDTHLLTDINTTNMKPIFEKLPNLNEKFQAILSNLDVSDIDFITISGDLIHEGTVEEYAELKKMLEKFVPSTPVLLALGNHDKKDNFYEAFTNERKENPYYYVRYFDEYRVIVLDSAVKNESVGAIFEDQLNWLEEKLLEDYQKGTIVILHHPIVWEDEALNMKNCDRLKEILTQSDTIGIFTGHTHMNGLFHVNDIPQFTSEGIAFGLVKDDSQNISFTNQCAYNIYTVKDRFINMKRVHVEPSFERIMTFNYQEVFNHTKTGRV
jgi:3',5'-cyclic-AMP phosphodiesterase